MINLFSRKLKTILVLVILMCLTGLFTATAQQICSSQTGTNGGYDYEHWTDGGGTACMTLGSGGSFSVSWQNCNNFVSRTGRKYDDSQTYQQLGNITINYACTYNPNGNSYLTVYGWTHNPLIEFYVVEAWGTWRPPGGSSKGQVTIDGGTYDIYQMQRDNAPSIEGTKTFQQYWSVRTSNKTSGSISVTSHFNAWANKGMSLGKFHECAFAVEGYQSSGSANVTSMTFGTATTTTTTTSSGATPTPTTTTTTTSSGCSCTLGDVDCSGGIDIVDALLIAQEYVGLSPANYNACAADVTKDGTTDIIDALRIAQCYVGLVSCDF